MASQQTGDGYQILKDEIDYTALKGACVVITGGASGLGEATTIEFAKHGAYVTIADMQVDAGSALVKKLNSQDYHVTFVKCDVTDHASTLEAFKHAIAFSPHKALDIAILFAGTDGASRGLVDEVLANDLSSDPVAPNHKAINVNLIGGYLSASIALHYFRVAGSGSNATRKRSLVLVSSMTGYIDLPYNTDYSVSKYAIRGLFRSIRSQTHKVNARVNNLLPGYILTPLTKKVHHIEDPNEPSKATGYKLPWAPIEYVVEACLRCATDQNLDGRALGIFPSGVIDINEDVATGYGGSGLLNVMEKDGFFDIPSLFPPRK